MLANHGVIVTGSSVEEATYRAATVDRQCRLMYDVVTSGRPYRLLPSSFLGPHEAEPDRAGPRLFLGWRGADAAPPRARGSGLMSINIEDLTANRSFTTGGKVGGQATFLPEPEKRPRRYTVISVDDHIVEPPDTFTGRVPSRLEERAPHVVERDDGSEVWVFDGEEIPNVGFNAVVGRPVSEYSFEPTRFDEMRRGAWDIHARVADMDINGVYASVNFPSFLPGFAGQRLQLRP